MTIPSEDLALVLPYVADHDDDEAVIMRYEHLTQTRYAHKIAIIWKELALQSHIEQFHTPITAETIEQRKAELANPVSESIIDRLRVLAQDPLDELNNVDANLSTRSLCKKISTPPSATTDQDEHLQELRMCLPPNTWNF